MTRLLTICCLLLVLAACSTTPSKVAKGGNPTLEGAPTWVLDPGSVKGLAAVGSAQKSPGGIQFQRNEAMATGRDELARMISIRVSNSFKNFNRSTGVGDAQTFDKVTEDVSKQVAKETLNGSHQKDLWVAPDGTLFVLVSLDPKDVADLVKQAAVASFKNDSAKWQQEEAKKAFQELDASIDKEFSSK